MPYDDPRIVILLGQVSELRLPGEPPRGKKHGRVEFSAPGFMGGKPAKSKGTKEKIAAFAPLMAYIPETIAEFFYDPLAVFPYGRIRIPLWQLNLRKASSCGR
jgi:hypothetical protein